MNILEETQKRITIENLEKKLHQAKTHYYNDNTIMCDIEFDALEEKLRELDPQNNYFKLVGVATTQGNSIKHNIPMRSMGKAKTKEEFDKWVKKLKLPSSTKYVLEPKIDGLSCTCKYINGKLQYVATRGDGSIGKNISHIIPYVADIKDTILFTNKEIEVRGELYLPVDTEIDTQGKPLRNNCVGLINRVSDKDDLKYVRFVAYKLEGMDIKTEEEKLQILLASGFNVITWLTSLSTEIEYFYEDYLAHWRATWEYETDGITIVVNNTKLHDELDSRWEVNHHNHYNLAWKPPSKTKTSTLRSIDWQMSKNGNIVPVGVFDTVTINGANISRATLNNLEHVVNLKLNIGDQITVVLANDVIPGILNNVSINSIRNLSPIPTSCPHCQTSLIKKGVHLYCPNKNCKEQLIQRIIYWVKESNTENVAEGTLRALYDLDILTSIKDLYTLTEKDLQGIEGFKDKKIKTFVEGFKQNKELTPIELLSKLNIPLVRKKALTKLGIKSIIAFKEFSNEDSVIARNVMEWKEDPTNMALLNDLLTVINLREEVVNTTLKGVIVMTGKASLPRKELILKVNEKGYEVANTISKNTTILLTDDVQGNSSKLVKARKLGVTVLTYEQFFNI